MKPRTKYAMLLIHMSAAVLLMLVHNDSLAWQANERVNSLTPKLKEKLQLSDVQASQVSDVLTRTLQQAEKESKSNKGNRQNLSRASKNRFDKMDKEIETILSQEQKATYQQVKKQLRKDLSERNARRKHN